MPQRHRLVVASMLATALAAPAMAAGPITRDDVERAQSRWCAGLVTIGAAHAAGDDAAAAARAMIAANYAFAADPAAADVLFKPTLAHGATTFRDDLEGTLAYFVGGDADYPGDAGFARRPWTTCRHAIAGVVADGDIAVAMGNVWVGDADGAETKVDKTFVYRRDAEGTLRIIAHMSALPYAPAAD
jgi:hypothetical protein